MTEFFYINYIIDKEKIGNIHIVYTNISKINKNLTKLTWIIEWIQPLMWNLLFYNITTSNKGVFVFTIILSLIHLLKSQ